MVEIKIYNNLTRKKEKFVPVAKDEVRFYSCGPTTYGLIHVGNARALVVGDLIHRIFKAFGYKITFVRNFTDVDDKIINAANVRGVSALEHSKEFTDECLKDIESLGMLPASHTPKVSETIPEIISFIERLIEKDCAYVVDGEVFYEVSKFSEYGKLSKKKLDDLVHGKRVEVDGKKKSPADFVLWKPVKDGEPAWDSPWGSGRPGWHIECSAMAKKFLGESIDIHHGGADLMFPHHENEIAQSEAANGKEFSKYWCHNEMLNFGTEKMSKSLGNIITARSFIETYSGEVLRQVLCSAHYRSKMEWNDDVIKRGIEDSERLHKFVIAFNLAKIKNCDISNVTESSDLEEEVKASLSGIKSDLANDFNVSGAAGKLFSLIRNLNRVCLTENGEYANKVKLSPSLVGAVEELIQFFTAATGLIHQNPEAVLKRLGDAKQRFGGDKQVKLTDGEIETLLIKRKEARAEKNFSRSDEIRDQLQSSGVKIKDNPDGTTSWTY